MKHGSTFSNVTLDNREHVVTIVCQGIVNIGRTLVLPGLLIIASFFFLYALFSRGASGVILFFVIFGLGIILVARQLLIWRTQALIITNQRIIDVDRRGVFKRVVSFAPLSQITDVYYESTGLWQTLSKSGNIVTILNDGKTKFEFKNVSRPERTLQIIHDVYKKQVAGFDGAELTAHELVKLINKIKSSLGEKRFRELIADKSKQDIDIP